MKPKFTFDPTAVHTVDNGTHSQPDTMSDKFRCQESERRFNAAFYVRRTTNARMPFGVRFNGEENNVDFRKS